MATQYKNSRIDIRKFTYIAILTALVVVLQVVGMVTGALTGLSINLSLVPIVVGGALCGRRAGTWLGCVSGFVVLFDPSTAGFLSFSFVGTVLICLLKGALSGFVAACAFKAINARKGNTLAATVVAGFLAPIVNTSVFILGCVTVFYGYVKSGTFGETFIGLLGLFIAINFIVEIVSSALLSPAVVRIIKTQKNK